MADNQDNPDTAQAYLADDRVDNITSDPQAETQIDNYKASAAQDKAIMNSDASSGTAVRDATARYKAAEFDIQQVKGAENTLNTELAAAAPSVTPTVSPNLNPSMSGPTSGTPTNTDGGNGNDTAYGGTPTGTIAAAAPSVTPTVSPNLNPSMSGPTSGTPTNTDGGNGNDTAYGGTPTGTIAAAAPSVTPTVSPNLNPSMSGPTSGTPTNTDGGNGNNTAYVVKPGDNLTDIAKNQGVSLDALEGVNKQITDYNQIYPGQTINIPTPTSTQGNTAGISDGGNAAIGNTASPESTALEAPSKSSGSRFLRIFSGKS